MDGCKRFTHIHFSMCKDPFHLFFKCRGTPCEIVLHMKVNASLCAKDFHNTSHLHNEK